MNVPEEPPDAVPTERPSEVAVLCDGENTVYTGYARRFAEDDDPPVVDSVAYPRGRRRRVTDRRYGGVRFGVRA